ncbi:hypothetical protein MAUB_06590 [Mycolicibacterium aubagnense]|uniref:Uncharacterized protein n=1 Tax=Mycolicibacterium aubagnense TaxID=319707 RepID=A0ABN5YLZ9_9MYCO|nr:hypothetical protein MAUB_06590 [Mycolicibacterium aubagnense]
MYGGRFSGLDRCGTGAASGTGTGLPIGAGAGAGTAAAVVSLDFVSVAGLSAQADGALPSGSSNAAQASPTTRIVAWVLVSFRILI